MQTLLVLLLIAFMIGAVVMLVRGIIAFLKTTEADLMGKGFNEAGLKQNKMMQGRILFQALAIIVVVLLLLLRKSG